MTSNVENNDDTMYISRSKVVNIGGQQCNLPGSASCRGFGSLLAEQATKLNRDKNKSHSKG